MILRQAVSDVRSIVKQLSADSLITDRLIASELRSAAAILVRRDLLARKLWASSAIFDQVRCLALKPVPLAECCSYRSACTIRRSVCRIQGIADLGTFGLAVQGIFTIDGTKKFKQASPARYENILRLRIPDKTLYYWITDGYLYLTDPDIEAVNLVAYFEHGVKLVGQGCQCNHARDDSGCINPLDQEFRCPAYLVDTAKAMVSEKLARLYKPALPDYVTDEKDTSR